jgi:hypothetical protein
LPLARQILSICGRRSPQRAGSNAEASRKPTVLRSRTKNLQIVATFAMEIGVHDDT